MNVEFISVCCVVFFLIIIALVRLEHAFSCLSHGYILINVLRVGYCILHRFFFMTLVFQVF